MKVNKHFAKRNEEVNQLKIEFEDKILYNNII